MMNTPETPENDVPARHAVLLHNQAGAPVLILADAICAIAPAPSVHINTAAMVWIGGEQPLVVRETPEQIQQMLPPIMIVMAKKPDEPGPAFNGLRITSD